MEKVKVIKDNAVLSINKEELAQYKARGYRELGATERVAPELEKEIKKFTKKVEELTKANEKLTADNEELTKANEKLTADMEELRKKLK